MSIEAMKQALEALEWNLPVIEDYGDKEQLNRQHKAITSLRQAIEQAEKREWVGLTEEEITALKRNGERYISSQEFARAIEAKLKEKNT